MNTVTFNREHIKFIIDDMLGSLRHHMTTSDFAMLRDEQRITLITQLLLFFNCRQLYELCINERNIEHIAELISLHIGKDFELCFQTSGSTGEPLLHKHSLFALQAEVTSFAGKIGGIKRVVSVVPRYHLYGCSFAFLLPLMLNIPVVQVPFLAVGGIMDELRNGDLLVGFPLFWLHLCALNRSFEHNIYGLTSTGPCPANVFDELYKLGIKRFYEIYGSSETGAAGIRCNYQDDFQLLPHWQKYDKNILQRAAASGEIEKIALPDNVLWNDEQSFQLIGRKDKAVQVGGSNVYPRRIAAIMETHPAIKFCQVRLMDKNEGSRLKAFIVPQETIYEADSLRKELVAWCRQRFTPAQRPRSFTFGYKLPANSIGKEANWPVLK